MEKEKIIKVYESIKSDDVKSFTSLMLSKSDLNLSFGRFPILSLCYLFKAEKILYAFEKYLLPINKFVFVDEYFEIYKTFKKHAKKSLRLFADSNEIVYPILMLGILDKRNLLAIKYKFLFKNEEILNKFRKIYNLNHKINIIANSSKFECASKKFTIKQKLVACVLSIIFITLSASSFVAMSVFYGKYGRGTKNSPIYISTEEEFLMALQKGDKYYVLENDLTISSEISVNSFSGTLDGGGNFVKFQDNMQAPIIKNLSGTIQNLTFDAFIQNGVFDRNFAILTENNIGNVKNCSFFVDINGQINSTSDVFVSIIACDNNGYIDDCSVKSNSTISNLGEKNAYLSGFVGRNFGTISNSQTLDSIFISDTVDLAGIAGENRGDILNTTNKIDLSQTSNKDWHPNCAGISMANYGLIENCFNYADVKSESTVENKPTDGDLYVFAGGICCDNFGNVFSSKNTGSISAESIISNVVIGGIVATNTTNETESVVFKCKSSIGTLTAKSLKSTVYVGGVVGQNISKITDSGFEGTISAHSDSDVTSSINVYAGGVVGFNNTSYSYSSVSGCYSNVLYDEPTENEKVGDNEERVNNIYGSIAGCVGFASYDIWGYISYMFSGTNNHYVQNESQNSVGYWLIYNVSGSRVGVQEVYSNETIFVVHDSIDDIPSEVRIYD